MCTPQKLVQQALESDGWTAGEKWVLKWQYMMHSHFQTALAEVICLADEGNMERLHHGFPDAVEAFLAWRDGDLGKRFAAVGLVE